MSPSSGFYGISMVSGQTLAKAQYVPFQVLSASLMLRLPFIIHSLRHLLVLATEGARARAFW
jgi:hypothetical protein